MAAQSFRLRPQCRDAAPARRWRQPAPRGQKCPRHWGGLATLPASAPRLRPPVENRRHTGPPPPRRRDALLWDRSRATHSGAPRVRPRSHGDRCWAETCQKKKCRFGSWQWSNAFSVARVAPRSARAAITGAGERAARGRRIGAFARCLGRIRTDKSSAWRLHPRLFPARSRRCFPRNCSAMTSSS